MKYNEIFANDALMRVKRPPMDNNLPFQEASLHSILSKKESQVLMRKDDPPIGRPRYLNDSESVLQSNRLAVFFWPRSINMDPNQGDFVKIHFKSRSQVK